jgi:hypothetical protein
MDDVVPRFEPGESIPRLIHQTHVGGALKGEMASNVSRIREQNPTWEHRLYDDAKVDGYIREHYGEKIHAYFKRIDPAYGAARADLFRYLVMYREGGVYLDLKSAFTRPIDEVLRGDEQFVISHWRDKEGEPHAGFGHLQEITSAGLREIQQWHIIAAPGHPFLRAVIAAVLRQIDEYVPWRGSVGFIGVLRLTGPIVYTKTISSILHLYPHTKIPNESALCLQYSVLDQTMAHQASAKHYTKQTVPVVRRKGARRLIDLCYVSLRNFKHRLQKRFS